LYSIQEMTTPEEIARCHPAMAQLRPDYSCDAFVAQVLEQFETERYHLAAVLDENVPIAVAGYRFARCLSAGRYLYVDDLITDGQRRSGGCGGMLLDWLVERAKAEGCDELHLDSGVHRFAAHRFYLTKRMEIRAHHFSLKLR
jgi:GNAT superfamily N-acetyltransferase